MAGAPLDLEAEVAEKEVVMVVKEPIQTREDEQKELWAQAVVD